MCPPNLPRFAALLFSSFLLISPPPASAADPDFAVEVLTPFWRAQPMTESMLFIQHSDDQPPRSSLLFLPTKILKVQSANRQTLFEQGRDYRLDRKTNSLVLPPESRIPFKTVEQMHPLMTSDAPKIVRQDGDKSRGIFFDNRDGYHQLQVEVTYTCLPKQWQGPIPQYVGDTLPRLMQKLQDQRPIKIFLSGDSISEGYNASAFSSAEPNCPAYGELFARGLEKQFGGPVTFNNLAVGGWQSSNGLKQTVDEKLGAEKPDLVIIAYGMNDVFRRDATAYQKNIQAIIDAIRQDSPDTEFILVASMLGNAQWGMPMEQFPLYRDALNKLCGNGVVLANLTDIWQELLKHKSFYDLAGNGVNHPNDFGHRVYAQVLLAMITPDEIINAKLVPPDARNAPDSELMLDLPETGEDPTLVDFENLPIVNGEHAIVSLSDPEWNFRLHNYLARFDGRYWCFWSHGSVIEDKARQHLRYSTSKDGLDWEKPAVLAGPPKEGFGYIARGLWIRDGELLALASLFEAPSYSGGELDLVAFRWNSQKKSWGPQQLVYPNALNNFPPKKLPDGKWMMSRRSSERHVSILIGGLDGIDSWQEIPFSLYNAEGGANPEEPFWWVLPDNNLVGLFRDNSRSGRLLRSFSTDNGHTWTPMVRTNFPDATSKFNTILTSTGRWVMISNPNRERRHPLCLSISNDGLVFTQMLRLPVPEPLDHQWADSDYGSTKYESMQYPHVIEHDDHLLVAFSRKKQSVEVVKIPLTALPPPR